MQSAEFEVRTADTDGSMYAENPCELAMAHGFALQRLIREARPTLPVILVTGRHELAAAATEVDRGGRTLFEKPFDRDRLLTAINLELRESAGSK